MRIKTETEDKLKIEIFAAVDEHEVGEGVYSYSVDDFALVGPDGEIWHKQHLDSGCKYINADVIEGFMKDIDVHDFILDRLNYEYCPADYVDEDYGRDR